jgi:two-component system, NarL family, response regulator DevR
MSRIRLLIVDDHEVLRLGLNTLLESEADLEVVAEAGNAEEAIREAERYRPDVVVMDVRLPGRSGLDACKEIRQRFPEIQVVMLTSYTNEDFVDRALRAGAAGYVLKQVGGGELVRAVRAAARGETALDPQTASRVVSRLRELESDAESDAFRDLSPREMDVMRLVAKGKSNKEIGAELNLSDITVRNYVSTMLEKLHLSNRIELAIYAVENNIDEHLNM